MEPLDVSNRDEPLARRSSGQGRASLAALITGSLVFPGAGNEQDAVPVVFDGDNAFDVVTSHMVPFELEIQPTSTIFHPNVVKQLTERDRGLLAWLGTGGGIFFQALVCFAFVGLYAYETVFKKISIQAIEAGEASPYDPATMVVGMGVISLITCTILSVYFKTLDQLLSKKTLRMIIVFSPSGVVVAVFNYLTFIILQYLDGDVFKVLLQGKILGVAIAARFFLGTKQAKTAWLALVLTVMSAIAFSQTKQLTGQSTTLAGIVSGQSHALSESQYQRLDNVLQADAEVARDFLWQAFQVMSNDNDKGVSLAQLVNKAAAPKSDDRAGSPVIGLMLTAFYVVADSVNSIYEQKNLQSEKSTPFYIQMFYKMTSFTVSAVMCSLTLGPAMESAGIKKKGKVTMLDDGFFHGWDNIWAVLAFASIILKEWFSGIVIKNLSSLVRQLCSITGVGVLYFLLLVHDCPMMKGETSRSHFCPSNLGREVTLGCMVADAMVMFCVVEFALSQIDRRKRKDFQKKAEEYEMAA